MIASLLRAAGIALASAILGLAVNAVSPRRIPYIAPPKTEAPATDYIPLDEAYELWSTGLGFFLDARPPADYAAGHIAHAFNVPANALDAHWPAIAPMLTAETPLVAYCDGEQCDLSHELKDALRRLGYQNVRVLKNGWTVWRAAGYPTQTGEHR